MDTTSSLRGHGRSIPAKYKLNDAEARKGTRVIAAADPTLFVALDQSRPGGGVYVLFGPSLAQGGWVPLLDIADDRGVPLTPPIAWEKVTHAIMRGREKGEGAIERCMAHNAALRARREREFHEHARACVGYAKKAVAGQLEGWGRWSAREVMLGIKSALYGSGKETAEGKSATTFAPGVQPETGGVRVEREKAIDQGVSDLVEAEKERHGV